jgi:Fe-S oxidoreductase
LGVDYHPWQPETKFHYGEDGNNFPETVLRCVGIGICRRGEAGTMCPSYMVTREEMHSTRGRARLLFEMLQGEVIRDGWRSKEVRAGLDLCLACKGCQSDCPMHVDMASYKAEFLSHYYQGRLRPRQAYSMGFIHLWAKLASRVPQLVNFLGRAPLIGNFVKWLAGISQKRKLPQFAPVTFRAWFAQRQAVNLDKPPVILWVDTFNNHFHPEILQAAVEVLEAAGHQIILPEKKLCCGRPLYDFGMLDHARRMLADILQSMRGHIRNGLPVVGVEPSCLVVFRDELKRLFPHDEDALKLSQNVLSLSEFLVKHSSFVFPRLAAEAVVHPHCHQNAVLKMKSEAELLKRVGLHFEILDGGCCGMAGSFGFEAEHYDISVKCGERMLLPRVRQEKNQKLVIADGFSCREQMEQLDHFRPLHTAELLLKVLREGKPENPEGKEIHQPHTVPELQTQSVLKNRRPVEPLEFEAK